jgi:hypothetical protein
MSKSIEYVDKPNEALVVQSEDEDSISLTSTPEPEAPEDNRFVWLSSR